MRLWLKALLTFLLITVVGFTFDRLLLKEGVPRGDLLFLSDSIVGIVAAALVFLLDMRQRQRSTFLSSRLHVISEMNHHIRNALQVISFYTRDGRDEKEVTAIREAVGRITWALREVLPQLGEDDDATVKELAE